MIPKDRSFTFDRVVRLALFSGLAWCLVLLLDYLSDVLLPFFTGLVLAYYLDPVTNRVQHVIKPRVQAALFTLASIILAIFLFVRLRGFFFILSLILLSISCFLDVFLTGIFILFILLVLSCLLVFYFFVNIYKKISFFYD